MKVNEKVVELLLEQAQKDYCLVPLVSYICGEVAVNDYEEGRLSYLKRYYCMNDKFKHGYGEMLRTFIANTDAKTVARALNIKIKERYDENVLYYDTVSHDEYEEWLDAIFCDPVNNNFLPIDVWDWLNEEYKYSEEGLRLRTYQGFEAPFSGETTESKAFFDELKPNLPPYPGYELSDDWCEDCEEVLPKLLDKYHPILTA